MLSKSLKEKKFVATAFCDLAKAFDCVSQRILIKKLQWYGDREAGVTLLANFLTRRVQITCSKEIFFSVRLIRCGVPQGYILGPLLLSKFIHERNFRRCRSCRLILFLDDASMISLKPNYSFLLLSMKINSQELVSHK